jgi:hypothetical protein
MIAWIAGGRRVQGGRTLGFNDCEKPVGEDGFLSDSSLVECA